MNAWENKRRTDNATIYLFSKCESFIEIYAKSSGLSADQLTHRVGELLLATGNREVLGVADRVSALQRNGTPGGQPVEQVEVVGRPYRGAQVVRSYTRRGPHWTQRPENRAKLNKHLREMHRARSVQAKRNPTLRKGFSYEGRHWTQQPKNKARLRTQMKVSREKFLEKIRKGK